MADLPNEEDETSDDNGNDGGEANNDEGQTIRPGDDVEPVEDSNNVGEEDGQGEEEEAEEGEGEAYDEIDLKEGHVLVTWVQTNLKKMTEEDNWETEEDPNDLIIVDRYCQYKYY